MAPAGLGTGIGLHLSQMAKGHGVKKSLEFTQLIKSIGECKAKVEEDVIIAREVDTLKRRLADPDLDKSRMQEYLLRLVYVEMLGHSASFGYIHAVKLTHEHHLPTKRVGYLAVSLFLDDTHDLLILIVNTLQQDLKSTDPLTVAAALTACSKVVSGDNVLSLLPQVTQLLAHRSDLVRKKALATLHRFYQRNPSSLGHLVPRFRTMLCDKDPSVMAAALNPLLDLAAEDPGSFRNLVPSFVNIFKQVLERRLPKGMDHPKGPKALPAAFVQVKLLKLLGLLAKGDEAAARQVVGVVGDCLKAADNGTNMGHAIIAEAVKTVSLLPLNSGLLQPAADAVARFLRAKSNNLKYVGIDVLCDVVAVSHQVAAQHQWAVIECLEDADETLRRKTLDLLYAMCGAHNVEVIAGRMLGYIRSGGADEPSVELTCSRVASLAERFAPSNEWFITTMNAVFELGGHLVKPELAQDLIRLIAEGAGVTGPGAAEADAALRGSACGAYWEVLLRPRVPIQLLCIALWVLGEYGLSSRVAADADELQERIVASVDAYGGTHGEGVTQVTRYALTALSKIVAQHGCPLSRGAVAMATQASRSRVTDLAQRAVELQALAAAPRPLAACAVPFDASAKNVAALDPDLRFLDGYVAQALARGASPYQPAEARTTLANPVSQAEAAAASSAARVRHTGNGASTPQPAPRGGDELDVFGLGVTSSPSSFRSPPPGPPQASAGAVYASPVQAQAQTPREEAAPVALNVSGTRKWGPHVTLAANPPPTPSAASPAAQRGNELDMLEAFAGLNTGGAGPSAAAQTPQQPQRSPAASTPPPQAVSRQAAAPPVDPAKAKLAAALFAGGSSSGAGPSGMSSSPAPAFAGRHAARQQQQHQQQGPESVDLLGGLASPPVAAKPSSSQDLLNQLAGPSTMAAPPMMPFVMPMAPMPHVPPVAQQAQQAADPFASLAAAMPSTGAPYPMAWMQQPQSGMGTPPAMPRSPAPPGGMAAMPQMPLAMPSPAPGMYQSPGVRVPQGPLDTRVLDQLLAGAPPPRTPLPAVFNSQTPAQAPPCTPDPFSNLLS